VALRQDLSEASIHLTTSPLYPPHLTIPGMNVPHPAPLG
jgi:hypothetical protein